MSQTINPLDYPITLAGNPKTSPRYAVKVKLKSGQEIEVADPTATRAMIVLMDMAAIQGGAASHYGGPAAFAELMSALHGYVFWRAQHAGKPWYKLFHLVNDAGHCENGIYALKANYGFADLSVESLKGFRSISSPLTGHGEAHLFPEGVWISNGPLGSGLPQAQGLALGDAWSGEKRVTVTAISDGACMEGEAKEAFTAIPGLAQRGLMAPFVCILSDNNTKLSGRIEEQSFSMQPYFHSLSEQGWRVIPIEDGHNLQSCMTAVEEAIEAATANPKVPVLIHAKTIKGKGTRKTEESSSGAHGFPLKKAEEVPPFLEELYAEQEVPEELLAWAREMIALEHSKKTLPKTHTAVPKMKIQEGIAAAMIATRKRGLPVVSISADLQGSTGVAGFHKEFPEASLDVGVAEANMVSTGVGLSKAGYIPVVDTFAQFGVTKGALPIIMGNLSLGPVIGVFSHTGFQDAADGASHQALSYAAMVSSIPHVEAYALSSRDEAEALLTQAIERFARLRKEGKVPPTQIFFLGRETFLKTYLSDNYKYELGRAQLAFDNSSEHANSVVIAVAGSLLGEALSAAQTLTSKGCGSIVVHTSCINKPDIKLFKEVMSKASGRLVTVEDHRVIGGMGSLLVQALVENGIPVAATCVGVKDHFGQSSYTAAELYEKHGLNEKGIVKAALDLV